MASGGNDRAIHLRAAANGENLAVLAGHTDGICTLCFLPSTRRLISAGADGTVRFWDVDKRAPVGEPMVTGGRIAEVATSIDGRLLGIGDSGKRTLSVWSIGETLRPSKQLFTMTWTGTQLRPAFAFSLDGTTIATSRGKGAFEVYDIESGRILFLVSGAQSHGVSVASSPADGTLASVTDDGGLTLWSPDQWEMRPLIESGVLPVRSLAFTPDSATLVAGTDHLVPDDCAEGETPPGPNVRGYAPPRPPLSVFSHRLVTTDSVPWNAAGPGFRLWNVATGIERPAPEPFPALTTSPLVAISNEGVMVAGGRDGCVAIWNKSGALVGRFAVNEQAGKPIATVFGLEQDAGTHAGRQTRLRRRIAILGRLEAIGRGDNRRHAAAHRC